MTRLFLAALTALLLLLTGCSSDDTSNDADEGATSSSPEATPSEEETPSEETESGEESGDRVGLGGVTFEAPEGWTTLDADEMNEGNADNEQLQEYADRMGMTDEQLEQTLESVDLYLVTDKGAQQGFLDNIVGTQIPGTMPNDSQLEMEFLSLGAKVVSIDRVETEAGEAALVVYELPVGAVVVNGRALSVSSGDSVVTLTVSAREVAASAELMDGIVASLASS